MQIGLTFLVAFIGSGSGGMLRHAVVLASLRFAGPGFPWAAMFVNVVGAALMGMIIGIFAARNIASAEL